MMKIVGIFFLFLLSFNPMKGQYKNNIVSTRNTGFLRDLTSRKGIIYPCVGKGKVLLELEHPHFNYRNQNLIKTDDGLYLYLFGTGILYQLLPFKPSDSLLYFKRLDKTYNADYNRGSIFYTYQQKIYNLGGYGFWRSNGVNRVFNEKDGEWDVSPLSEEIIPDVNVNWHDPKENIIYVPFQNFKNAATAEEALIKGKIDPNSYRLHLKTGTWEKLSRCTQPSIDLLSNGGLHLQTEMGLWVIAYDNCYCFDFKHNRVLKLKDKSLAQSISRSIATQQHQYYNQGKLYFESMKDLRYDSLVVDPSKFIVEPYPIFESTFPHFYYVAVLGLMLIPLIFVFRSTRKKSAPAPILMPEEDSSPTHVRSNFTEPEIQLIDFLISIKEENRTASMSEVNYIIGLKDKNVGLQKKVRSDIINSINEKFKLISKKDMPLIKNIRNENDKRYFEYLLCDEQLEWFLPIWMA